MDRPTQVASLTFIDPVSPFGFCGTRLDGTPCFPDYAGSGGGVINPEFCKRLEAKDRSADSPFSPLKIMQNSFWAPTYHEPRELQLLEEVLKSVTGADGFPGDSTPSPNWPGCAPGTRGIVNALSPKYCNWSGITSVTPKPPVLWVHGSDDTVVADNSGWDTGNLGKLGVLPGWPGPNIFPPQLMASQIRNVLKQYEVQGGKVKIEIFEGSGHGPLFDASEHFCDVFYSHLASK